MNACTRLCAVVGAVVFAIMPSFLAAEEPPCGDLSPACCAGVCPSYYGLVEALYLDRDNRTDRLVAIRVLGEGAPGPGTPLLSTGAMNFDWQPGVRALAGWQFHPDHAAEIGYLGIFDWTSTSSIGGNNNLAIPGDLGLASLDYFAADLMRLQYSSALHSAEVTLVESLGEGSLLCGFRYLSLDEQFNLNATDSDTGSSDYRIRTSNDLYGGQVGARWQSGIDALEWSAEGKVGLYGNDASQTQSVADFPPAFFLRAKQTARRGRVAFVGDFNLSALYPLNDIWAIRGGYNLIWIEGVALAPDQLDFTDTATSGQNLSTSGLFLHGVNLGLDARW